MDVRPKSDRRISRLNTMNAVSLDGSANPATSRLLRRDPRYLPPLLNGNLNPNTIMPSDNLNMEELTDERRKAIEKSVHTISVDALRELGNDLFIYLVHPWRQRYFSFIAENADSTFYHATTHDG